jgi:hypothetical protein
MLDPPLHQRPPNSVQGSIIGGSETAEKVRTVPVCFASAVGCGLARRATAHTPRDRGGRGGGARRLSRVLRPSAAAGRARGARRASPAGARRRQMGWQPRARARAAAGRGALS